MQHIIGIYNHQHLESHSIGNTLYLKYLKVITIITTMQLPIHVACRMAPLKDM